MTAPVFKTGEVPERVLGGFDSHPLPLELPVESIADCLEDFPMTCEPLRYQSGDVDARQRLVTSHDSQLVHRSSLKLANAFLADPKSIR